MIGNLYKITNTINNKSYIGKTYSSIEDRFTSHVKDSYRFPNRPLYRAIRKYGKDSFTIELIGQYAEGNLEAQEITAIKKYNTYGTSGYNATLGGDGRRYVTVSDEDAIQTYKDSVNLVQAAEILGISDKTLASILKTNNIDRKSKVTATAYKVIFTDLNMSFDTVDKAAQFLIDSDISNASLYATRQGIAKAASGQRKTYLGLKIKYLT